MSQNLNKIGTPVMWGSVGFVMETIMKSGGNEALKFHGRIVEVDKDSAADPDNKDMYAVIFCSSPHGTIVKVGISNVTEITEEEGFKELEKWEKLAKEDNKWYGGKLAFGKTTVGSNTK